VQGKYAEARNIFQKLQDEHPTDELLQFRIYLTYLLEKNDSAAKDALEKVLSSAIRRFITTATRRGNSLTEMRRARANGWTMATGCSPLSGRAISPMFFTISAGCNVALSRPPPRPQRWLLWPLQPRLLRPLRVPVSFPRRRGEEVPKPAAMGNCAPVRRRSAIAWAAYSRPINKRMMMITTIRPNPPLGP
jgi:hypothetical protein